AAGESRGVCCRAKRGAKRVCCTASVIKASAEIAADIEAGPVIWIGQSDGDVRWRRNERRKVRSQRGCTTSNAQRNNTRQSLHRQFPDLSCPRCRPSRHLRALESNEVINDTARARIYNPTTAQHLEASQCKAVFG